MTENRECRILVIESVSGLRNRMLAALSGHGYQVRTYPLPEAALEELKKAARTSPYQVIITSYMMPKIKGDEILRKAREISPTTQRILISDVTELETLVDVVNSAGIHFCLTLPFSDDDLLHHVSQCCLQYEMSRKKDDYNRLTQQQNRQLFQIATNFKKKEAQYLAQVELKKKEGRALESRIRSAGGNLQPDRPVSLKDLPALRRAFHSPRDLAAEFLSVTDEIRKILETAVLNSRISLTPVSYATVLEKKGEFLPHEGLARNLMPLISVLLMDKTMPSEKTVRPEEKSLNELFELQLSDNRIEASLRIKTVDTHHLTPAHVMRFLEMNKIIYGVKDTDEIESWLFKSLPDDPPFVVAEGRDPGYPRNSTIRYHFPVNFLHIGKVLEDGSIDFKERGETPYVESSKLLAEKTPSVRGSAGMDVHGNPIPVEEPVDLSFSPGPGAYISEDGLKIYAETSGRPQLDALGNVSVCHEYKVKGDIGFETGNVSFDGNVIVDGAVKRGFKVKCASLTAKEIQGAELDISGDLNVSYGIENTDLVNVKGTIQAKFIHSSNINAFGDLIVQKEIMDSTIYLSGACTNEHGMISNSRISAKMGISAGTIGNPMSTPSKLTVGVDENINLMVAGLNSTLEANIKSIQELEAEMTALEKENQSLHALITKHAYVQDRAQLELKDLKQKMEAAKSTGDTAAQQELANSAKEIRERAREAEEEIGKGFARQDDISIRIGQDNGRVSEIEEQNRIIIDEKKRLLEFSGRKKPLPEVKVSRKIEPGTYISSANASIRIYDPTVRCRIREHARVSDDTGQTLFYEMKIDSY
ncbi:MAG: FapA family protein [Desulfobacula sp.]|jgi:hypothetical protein